MVPSLSMSQRHDPVVLGIKPSASGKSGLPSPTRPLRKSTTGGIYKPTSLFTDFLATRSCNHTAVVLAQHCSCSLAIAILHGKHALRVSLRDLDCSKSQLHF